MKDREQTTKVSVRVSLHLNNKLSRSLLWFKLFILSFVLLAEKLHHVNFIILSHVITDSKDVIFVCLLLTIVPPDAKTVPAN